MQSQFELMLERVFLLINDETGESRRFVIKMGRPYWTEPEVEAACPIIIEGLLDRQQEIFGIDPLDAIEMAIKFLNSFLSERPATEKVCWSTGDPYFDNEQGSSDA